jgi:hypothetical protein
MAVSAPGLDRTNLDHELNRQTKACGALTQSDSVGLWISLRLNVQDNVISRNSFLSRGAPASR